MTRDRKQVSEGTGADCLGDLLLAVTWLARAAVHYGSPLRAGDVVLSGALGPMADGRCPGRLGFHRRDLRPRLRLRVVYGGGLLGTVKVAVIGSGNMT
jgi:hypothetical protein